MTTTKKTTAAKTKKTTAAKSKKNPAVPAGSPQVTAPGAGAQDTPTPANVGQVGGYAGAIFDPRTGAHVMPGENVDGPDVPANPAPAPAGAPGAE